MLRRLSQIRDWACSHNPKPFRTSQLDAVRGFEDEDDIERKRRREAAAKGIILVGRL